MKYYKNDIVEIVTAKYKSWNDIPAHEKGYFENQDEPAPFIGQRFIVYISNEHILYASINKRLCLASRPDCVILVKRNLSNWIRHFYYTLTKIHF